MLKLRAATEFQARAKIGAPAHITTGIASANSIQPSARGAPHVPMRRGAQCPSIASAASGTPKPTPTQKRRVISASSGSAASSRAGAAGSSDMPHTGHAPGRSWRTCGCIGHVHPPSGPGAVDDLGDIGVISSGPRQRAGLKFPRGATREPALAQSLGRPGYASHAPSSRSGSPAPLSRAAHGLWRRR